MDHSERQMMSKYCICLDDVYNAHERIRGGAHCTPVLTCSSLDRMATDASRQLEEKRGIIRDGVSADAGQRQFYFKVEAFQKTGSFKFRGALNAVKQIVETRQSSSESISGNRFDAIEVVTHSSGNHAQALALAAKVASDEKHDVSESIVPCVHATIVMPRGAPEIKQRAVLGYGASVVLVDNTNDARESEADRISKETGALFIHPSEDPRVIAGQGTVSLEFVKQVDNIRQNAHRQSGPGGSALDAVIIPVGGGGLASGNAIALRGLLGSKVKIILAEPSVLNDAKRSKDANKLLGHTEGNMLNSIADGLKTTLGPNTWPIIRDQVDDIFTVSEEEIVRATQLVWERLKICIEPSAGVGVAVALGEEFAYKYKLRDGVTHVGVILCGGNVDIAQIAQLMAHAR